MTTRHLIYIPALAFVLMQATCNDQPNAVQDSNTDKPVVLTGPSTGNPEHDYASFCASCHGENLQAFIEGNWMYGKAWNQVYSSIAKGYADDGMPGFAESFSKKEISELTDYILESIEDNREDEFKVDGPEDGTITSEELNFELATIAAGFQIPWGIAFLSEEDFLVTERRGRLWHVNIYGERNEIKGVPQVRNGGQGGLLDVELHPDYHNNGWIYLSYSKPVGTMATTAVCRAQLEGDQLIMVEEIFAAEPALPTRHHYGSRLQFDQNGHLYVTVGDRGRRDDNPQSLSNHCGKVHRMYDTGEAVHDNMFYGLKGKVPSIFTFGHRNPQGMAMHPETGEMWIHEHGPRGGDEINRLQKGENYGWPVISYGINYNGTIFTEKTKEPGMLQPDHYWVPSIAPCGMDFVSGERWKAWDGDLLVGSLRYRFVSRVKFENGKVVGEEDLLKDIGRVREIEQGPNGDIYIVVEDPGRIVRISPS